MGDTSRLQTGSTKLHRIVVRVAKLCARVVDTLVIEDPDALCWLRPDLWVGLAG